MQIIFNWRILVKILFFINFILEPVSSMKNIYRVSKQASKKISPTVSAVLLECPKRSSNTRSTDSCDRKVVVNIRVSPSDNLDKVHKYLILDELFDQKRQTRAKIMSPYMIELTRGEPILMYPLNFDKSIRCGTCSTSNSNISDSTRTTKANNSVGQNVNIIKKDIGMAPNGKLGDVKSHLTDESYMAARDVAEGGNEKNVEESRGRVIYAGNDMPVYYDYVDKDNSHRQVQAEASLVSNKNVANENIMKPGRQTISHHILGKSSNDPLENVVNMSKSRSSNTNDPPKLRILDQQKMPYRTSENSAPYADCTCQHGDCSRYSHKVGGNKVTEKIFNDKISFPLKGEYSGEGEVKESHQQRANKANDDDYYNDDEYEDVRGSSISMSRKVTRKNDLPIQEINDESSNSDEPQDVESDISPKEITKSSDFPLKVPSKRDNDLRKRTESGQRSGASLTTNRLPKSCCRGYNTLKPSGPHSYFRNNIYPDVMNGQKYRRNDIKEAIERKQSIDDRNDKSYQEYMSQSSLRHGDKSSLKSSHHKSLEDKLPKEEQKEEPDSEFISSEMESLNVMGAQKLNANYHSPNKNEFKDSLNPHKSPKHRFPPSLDDDNKSARNGGNKISNNFPLHSSPPESSDNSLYHSNYGNYAPKEARIEDDKRLLPRIRCQLLPSEEGSITAGQSPVDLREMNQLHRSINSGPFSDYPSSLSNGIANVNGLIDPRFHFSLDSNPIYDTDIHDKTISGVHDDHGSGGNSRNSFVQDNGKNRIYEARNYFLGRNGKDKFNGIYENFDDNSILEKKSDAPARDDLYIANLNANDKLPLKMQLQNNGREAGSSGNENASDDKDKKTERSNSAAIEAADMVSSVRSAETLNKRNELKNSWPTIYKKKLGVNLKKSINQAANRRFKNENTNTRSLKQNHFRSQARSSLYAQPKGAPDRIQREPYPNIPSEYLPASVPFEISLSDPNLTVHDKMDLLDTLNPPSTGNSEFERYEAEMQNTHYPIQQTLNTCRMPLDYGKVLNTESDKNPKSDEHSGIKKRSFIVYDDLKMRNNDEYYDEMAPPDVPVIEEVYPKKSSLVNNEDAVEGCHCANKLGTHDKHKDGGEKMSGQPVSNLWYSVFNMSAPLQFLAVRVRIFRKRENTWWRIAPSITLTSLSGTYANANLSILFSSHAEIFSFEKPSILKDHRLLIPKMDSHNPKNLIAISNEKFDLSDNNKDAIKEVCDAALHQTGSKNRGRKRDNDGIFTVGDFGVFPTDMSLVDDCPNDHSHLCLNLLKEEAPAHSVKIEFPFKDNAIITRDENKVRISSIVNDATANGALLVRATLINEGLIPRNFTVIISKCPVSTNNVVRKVFLPHIGETLSFILPLMHSNPKTKYVCEVEVRNSANQFVAKRQMRVQPTMRCFCVWECSCYCISDIASTFVYDACEKLPTSMEQDAGFVERVKRKSNFWGILRFVGILVAVMFLLGLLKAIFGCFYLKVDEWKYDYVQPQNSYEYASKYEHFFVNAFFFVVIPFVFCCKCFTPTKKDLEESQTKWECALVYRELEISRNGFDFRNSDDEDTILSQHLERQSSTRFKGGSESEFKYYFDEDDRDQDFVINTLEESRESWRRMTALDGHYSEELNSADPKHKEAVELVRNLVAAKIVYRTLSQPLGNVNVPLDQSYSIRGYFVPVIGTGYQFITHIPLRQHWIICPDINTLRPIIPPVVLSSKEFTRNYNSKIEVLEANDLSVSPSVDAPCINVLVQDINMYHHPGSDEPNEDP